VLSHFVSGDVLQFFVLESSELGYLIGFAGAACAEKVGNVSLVGELIFKLDTFNVGPRDVIAEFFPTVLIEIGSNFRELLISNGVGLGFDLVADCCSLDSSGFAVSIV